MMRIMMGAQESGWILRELDQELAVNPEAFRNGNQREHGSNGLGFFGAQNFGLTDLR